MATNALTNAMFMILLSAAALGIASANKDWGYGNYGGGWGGGGGSPRHRRPSEHIPRKIVVGGNQTWAFGFDYTNWAMRNGPFFVNDTLVFKYKMPADNSTRPHSVYQLPDLRSFLKCDVSKGKKLANWTDGGGEGFEFTMDKWQPYFFACGEASGIHCNLGRMKFFVVPLLPRWWNY
ncbi:hypothetical protein LINPERPRIM_LOCUS16633 [Linum perenne]